MNEPDTARLATQRGPNADASPRRRVLLVEDEASIREVLSQYLALEGFAIIGVADGTEALRMAQSAPPDLVILALMLPGVDGLEVCRRLWASSAVPILMLTARGEATFIGPNILDVRLASGETS